MVSLEGGHRPLFETCGSWWCRRSFAASFGGCGENVSLPVNEGDFGQGAWFGGFDAVGGVGVFRACRSGLDRGKRRENRYFGLFLKKSAGWCFVGLYGGF